MSKRLGPNEIVTIETLIAKEQTNVEIARIMGLTEGAVRYHRRRLNEDPKVDGRKDKVTKLNGFEEGVLGWIGQHYDLPPQEPINILALYEYLKRELEYPGSYKAVLRYARKHFSVPVGRPKRRVETPPGVQSQTDWTSIADINIAGVPQTLSLMVMTLAHSRFTVAIWASSENQLSWHHCHNEAYKRLGGVAAVNRIDNLATGVSSGAGGNAIINDAFKAYARAVRFHPDPCQAYSPEQKGKVERKNRSFKKRFLPADHYFSSVADLQHCTDETLLEESRRTICPATGKTVYKTWQDEIPMLGPLPCLPEPFDVAVTRKVTEDCLVNFEGRSYGLPYRYWRQTVEVKGCAHTVQILAEGQVVREYQRKSKERILFHSVDYDEDLNADCPRPLPLGKMGTRIQEIYDTPVEERPIDLYAALTEVARC